MICPNCGHEINESPPIADIERPARSKVDEITWEEAKAIKHVEAAWRNWKKDILQSTEAFYSIPTTWPDRIRATFKQRGMEFIKLVTPAVIHAAQINKGQMTFGWGVVEAYLDSDQYRQRKPQSTQDTVVMTPETDERIQHFGAWRQRLKSTDAQAIIDTARQAEPKIDITKALFTYWQENVEKP